MPVQTFFEETEPAVRHLFEGMDIYDSIRPPSIMMYVDKSGAVRMSKEEADNLMRLSQESIALMFSRATLAGSILQVAYLGLKLFSKNEHLPSHCEAFGIRPGSSLVKFCVGREVNNIPIGLLIYSGRVQYNHWEEKLKNDVASNIFTHLVYSYYDNPMLDMIYELDYPEPRPVSHDIVRHELKWMAYNDYLQDMKTMLLHS